MNTPTIIAHRGGKDEAEENSAESFADALSHGILGAETDVRLTRDGHVVIMHDPTVDRTTTSTGHIAEMTLSEVKSLSLRKTGQRVPTLEEFCEVYRGRADADIEIELKLDAGSEQADRMDHYLRSVYETSSSILAPGTFAFSSFHPATLRRMRALFPDAALAFITWSNTAEVILSASLMGCRRLCTVWDNSTAHGVVLTHQAGMTANLWCSDTPEVYRLVSLMGADVSTSNVPRAICAAAAAQIADSR